MPSVTLDIASTNEGLRFAAAGVLQLERAGGAGVFQHRLAGRRRCGLAGFALEGAVVLRRAAESIVRRARSRDSSAAASIAS
jgi:hypothetical protein